MPAPLRDHGPALPPGRTELDTQATLDEARASLAAAAERTAQLLRAANDGAGPVHRSDWTVAEVGAHMVVAPRVYAASARGDLEPFRAYMPAIESYHDRMTAVTTATLETVAERSPASLAGLITDAVQDYLAATAGMPAEARLQTPWYAPDASLSVTASTCLLLGEQVIHGYDVARTLRRQWPISRSAALLLVNAFEAMLPVVVDPDAAAGVRMQCVMHIRGGPQLHVRLDDGRVDVRRDPYDGERPDCHISAEPVAFLLVGYGRINQWQAIATGRLTAWGRKPWRALSFRALFHNP